jgi:hypothetical protein
MPNAFHHYDFSSIFLHLDNILTVAVVSQLRCFSPQYILSIFFRIICKCAFQDMHLSWQLLHHLESSCTVNALDFSKQGKVDFRKAVSICLNLPCALIINC